MVQLSHPYVTTEKTIAVYIGGVYFKELALMIMEAGKSKIHRIGQQAEDRKELLFQFKCKGRLLQTSLLLE